MKLIALRLKNFQGISEFELVTNGNNVEIHGDNATGKTTLANGITWLLYDKASTGEKGYNPKTVDADGNDVHYLDHSVEGVFEHDGAQIMLKKTMREDWKKKRGSNVEEFVGHLIDYYIDGVPVKQKEYRATLDRICEPEKAKILTIPEYFAQDMHWKDRRNILLELCADITDQQVMDTNEELENLRHFLLKPNSKDQFYTVEEYLAIANAKKNEINGELKLIPARIDEATKAMPNVMGLDADEIAGMLEIAVARKAKYQGELDALKAAGQNSELRIQLAEAKAELSEANAKFNAEQTAKNREVEDALHQIDVTLHEIDRTCNEYTRKAEDVEAKMNRMIRKREEVFAEYKNVQSQSFEQQETCPTCGQAIPEEQARAAWEQFNYNKSQKLHEINERGKKECSKDMIAALQAELKAIGEKIAELEDRKVRERAKEAEIESRRDVRQFGSTGEYALISSKIAQIQALIDNQSNTPSNATELLMRQIRDAQSEIDALEGQKLNFRYAQAQKDRIEQLKAQEKKLAQEYEKIQHGVYLAERFTTLKAEMLTDAINSKFSAVRFKLYDTQINGGIVDCCDVMVPCANGLVPFVKANNAGRINAGLQIIDTLGKHWGSTLPIIVDNAESVTRMVRTEAQQIRFYVDVNAKQLNVKEG